MLPVSLISQIQTMYLLDRSDHNLMTYVLLDPAASPVSLSIDPSNLVNPYGLAMNEANSELYWSDNSAKLIRSSSLSGVLGEAVALDSAVVPMDFRIDGINQQLYCIDQSTGSILRSDLAEGEWTVVFQDTAAAALSVAIDAAGDRLFWADKSGTIFQISLTDDPAATLVASTGGTPRRLAYDNDGELYYSDDAANAIIAVNVSTGASRTVYEANSNDDEETDESPFGLYLDTQAKWVYWTDYSQGTVSRIRFDGSDRETLLEDMGEVVGIVMQAGLPILDDLGVPDQTTITVSPNLSVRPNPATSAVTIRLQGDELPQGAQLRIYDQSGIRVLDIPMNARSKNIVVGDYPAGLYRCVVAWSAGVEITSFIVAR